MVLDRNNNKEVAVQLGAGSMGTAILRRVAAGKKILLGGRRQSSLDKAADSLRYSGYDVETFVVDAVDPIQVRAFEKNEILKMMEFYGSDLQAKKLIAEKLGISLASLYAKLK